MTVYNLLIKFTRQKDKRQIFLFPLFISRPYPITPSFFGLVSFPSRFAMPKKKYTFAL
jgi:hypothetical protein